MGMEVVPCICFQVYIAKEFTKGEKLVCGEGYPFDPSLLLFFQPCLGLGIAASIRVGNELGAGNPQGAKRASYAAISASCK